MNQKYSFTFMTTNICRKATRESSAVINMLFLQDEQTCLAFTSGMSSFTLIKQQQCIYFHQAASNFHVILQTMCTCSDHLNRFSSFAASKIETVQCWSLKSSVLSVLVDPKYPYSMKLRQLWEEDAKERARVDEEMRRIVFCVETCKNISVKKESERKKASASTWILQDYNTHTNTW